jgi:Protein of unknown function (DUF1360)
MILLIAGLAVYRITRLITEDSITDSLRDAVAEKWPGEWADTLINCPFCTSFWAAAAVTILLLPALSLPFVVWLLLPWALSGFASILSVVV